MNNFFIALLVIVTPMLFMWQPYDLRHFTTAVFCTLGMWAVLFNVIYISVPNVYILAFGALLIFSMMWTTNYHQSLIDLLYWLSMLFVYEVSKFVPIDFLMVIITIPIAFIFPIAVWQKYQKFPHIGSVYGNANHLGSHCVIMFFAALWLTINISLWNIIPLSIIFLTMIIAEECKAAFLSIIIGSTYIAFNLMPPQYKIPAIVLICVWIPIILIRKIWIRPVRSVMKKRIRMYAKEQAIKTGKTEQECYDKRYREEKDLPPFYSARLGHLMAVWSCIKKRPIFGWGLRSFRREQFFAVDRILKKDMKAFDNIIPPTTHKLHCDILEIWHELGIVGVVLFGFILYQIPYSNDVVVTGGIISMLVLSMTFFPLREAYTAIPFFAMAGALSHAECCKLISPTPVLVTAALAITYICYIVAIKRIISLFYWFKIPRAKDEDEYTRSLRNAHRLDPFNNHILMHLFRQTINTNRDFALNAVMRMTEHYDGTVTAKSIVDIRPHFPEPPKPEPPKPKNKKKKKKKKGKKK